ncbi:unnamed protein product [Lota lota]
MLTHAVQLLCAGRSPGGGAAPACTLLCSFCRPLVALPSRDWASATTCLPRPGQAKPQPGPGPIHPPHCTVLRPVLRSECFEPAAMSPVCPALARGPPSVRTSCGPPR